MLELNSEPVDRCGAPACVCQVPHCLDLSPGSAVPHELAVC